MSKKPFSEIKKMLKKNKPLDKPRRQLIDKAVQDIHTDKKQLDDVLRGLDQDLQKDIMKELKRRGDDVYPERGPDKK